MTAIAPPNLTPPLTSSPSGGPPRGLIWRDGKWHVRFAGFTKERKLKCWNKHSLHGKRNQRTPIEGVIPCGFKRDRHTTDAQACVARMFVFRIRAGRIFAMDITKEEDDHVELQNMDLDDIIEYFGLDFAERS